MSDTPVIPTEAVEAAAAEKWTAAFKEAIEETGSLDAHWLVFRDEQGWGCDSCGWAGAKIEDFWKTHERRDHDIPF